MANSEAVGTSRREPVISGSDRAIVWIVLGIAFAVVAFVTVLATSMAIHRLAESKDLAACVAQFGREWRPIQVVKPAGYTTVRQSCVAIGTPSGSIGFTTDQ